MAQAELSANVGALSSHTLSDSFHKINRTFGAIRPINALKQITIFSEKCEA
jgi:hypothetical protein